VGPVRAGRVSRCGRRTRLVGMLGRVPMALATSVLLMAGAWLWLDYKWGRELDAELAAMRREGLLVPVEALLPASVDPVTNAAPLYKEASDAYGRFWARLGARERSGLRAYASGTLPSVGSRRRPWGPPTRSVEAGAATPAAVDAMLSDADAKEALRLFELASCRPCCVLPVGWHRGGVPDLGPDRAEGYLFATVVVFAKARLELDLKRPDEAFRWYVVGLVAHRHLTLQLAPFLHGLTSPLVGRLSRLGETIAEAKLARVQVERVDGLLASIARAEAGAVADRPRLDLAAETRTYDLLLSEPDAASEAWGRMWEGSGLELAARIYFTPMARPVHRLDYLRYLTAMRVAVALAPLPYRQAVAAYDALHEETSDPRLVWAVTTAMGQGPRPGRAVILANALHWPLQWKVLCTQYVLRSVWRDARVARIGMVRVLLRLQSYRSTHGQFPPSLDALEQSTRERLPRDPFSGGPFGYSRMGEGFRLYSIGPDLADDAGKTQTVMDIPHEPGDIVVDWPDAQAERGG